MTRQIALCPNCLTGNVWEQGWTYTQWQPMAWEDGEPTDYAETKTFDAEACANRYICRRCLHEFDKPVFVDLDSWSQSDD